MSVDLNAVTFNISVVGETTGEKWTGQFTTKVRLSHRDHLRLDSIRRELLGVNPESASPRARQSADIFASASVHITKAPSFWTSSGNGMDLADDNVLAEVWAGIEKAKTEYAQSLKLDEDLAKQELAK